MDWGDKPSFFFIKILNQYVLEIIMTFSKKVCFSDVNLNCLKYHNYSKSALIIDFCILCSHLLKGLKLIYLGWLFDLWEHLIEVCNLNTNLMKPLTDLGHLRQVLWQIITLTYLLYSCIDAISCFCSTNKMPKIFSLRIWISNWSKDSKSSFCS